MKLTEAKICLSCEWVHKELVCPKCGDSHSFYLSKWITPTNRNYRETEPPILKEVEAPCLRT